MLPKSRHLAKSGHLAIAALLLATTACHRDSSRSEAEEQVDKLQAENADLRAQLQDYKARDAARQDTEDRQLAERRAPATPTAARTPEDASTAADNAAAAAKEAIDAAKM